MRGLRRPPEVTGAGAGIVPVCMTLLSIEPSERSADRGERRPFGSLCDSIAATPAKSTENTQVCEIKKTTNFTIFILPDQCAAVKRKRPKGQFFGPCASIKDPLTRFRAGSEDIRQFRATALPVLKVFTIVAGRRGPVCLIAGRMGAPSPVPGSGARKRGLRRFDRHRPQIASIHHVSRANGWRFSGSLRASICTIRCRRNPSVRSRLQPGCLWCRNRW
jgi:hypothetical protein